MRISIVEDNTVLADGIARAFKQDGHGVDELHRGRAAIDFILQEDIDLVILDINLPDISGLEVLQQIRQRKKDMPVLLLTARAEVSEKINGLDAGADDYLTKPFDLDELKARARALYRRRNKDQINLVTLQALEFDLTRRRLSIAGDALELPRREFALIELLIGRVGQVVSKTQIIDHLYGSGSEVEESTVEIYVHRIRKRLTGSGVEIKTLRGLGYCLQALR